ncbi:hypothetical protein M9H77_23881 [Catharanthus roseus]|uniref:Uncharacterized protein n=1 Tax=Catharanthus roseus TaxID=4058 RepID=A0ACC0AUA0_CATRO|nr:hypothetical protein M9H77_23881 [Catharanthus roseus]
MVGISYHHRWGSVPSLLAAPRPTADDRKSQVSIELKLGLMTRARMKKLKASNGNKDNVMVAYMEDDLKNKFEEFKGQGKASKLFLICSIIKDYSREQVDCENG